MKVTRGLCFFWLFFAVFFSLTPVFPVLGDEGKDSLSDLSGEGKTSITDETYKLQPGDRINIKIYPEDDYIKGGETQISPDGNITLPLIGKVSVQGKALLEVQQELVKIIDADYLVNPEVAIEVMQYREQSFTVMGQVKKPGRFAFPPGATRFTLLQAISLAGGFSEVANIKKIRVIRQAEGKNKILKANAEDIISGKESDIALEAEDVINVSESLF